MIVLFSTNCPRCRVLEQKLNAANINFITINDMQEVINQGFVSAPVLRVDTTYYDFKQAIDGINSFDNCPECELN